MAQWLSEDAHSITVIEANENVAKELDGQIDGRVIQGDGTSINTLLDAGAPEAELFMALTADNNVNLVASSMAKKLGAAKVICRVQPGLQRDEWLFDLRAHFGIDYVFSSERLAAAELSKFIRNPDSLVVVVDQTTRSAGLAMYLKRNQPDGASSIRLRFENAPFDTLVEWLAELQSKYNVSAISANIDMASDPGRVNCNFTLGRTGA